MEDKIKPKKSLGQNFLTNQKYVFDMISCSEIKNNDLVLEIGGGKGVLTKKILEQNFLKLICVEKDKRLYDFLSYKFDKYIKNEKLIILNEDILKIDIKNFLEKKLSTTDYKLKIIANIPYYITGAIIEKFFTEKKRPVSMTLLIQKEVAERLISKNKKESILSLTSAFYSETKIISKVSAGNFFPKPKVDSAIIKMTIHKNILEGEFDEKIEQEYLKLIKNAFSHKRKMLINNLKSKYTNIDFGVIFDELKLNKKIRSEELKKEDYLNIVFKMLNFKK